MVSIGRRWAYLNLPPLFIISQQGRGVAEVWRHLFDGLETTVFHTQRYAHRVIVAPAPAHTDFPHSADPATLFLDSASGRWWSGAKAKGQPVLAE